MKIPFDWLAEFVDLEKISPEELASELSLKAFEVEDLDWIGAKIKGPLLAGRIIQIEKHPNADKLQITKIQVSSNEEPLQIVCGARNIEVGQIVPVALPGACVLNRQTGEPLQIKVGKIRDVESHGMLCSAGEIGLEGGEGILILAEQTQIGTDLIAELNLKPKAVLNVASRSNRGDALSVLGIARETAATLNIPLKRDFYKEPYAEAWASLSNNAPTISSAIEAQAACNTLGFLKIGKIQIAQSPQWLREKLQLAGISLINNIVDITNYVMLELGQPMHAYDCSRLNLSSEVLVRFAREGEKLITLDNAERKLSSENLLIADTNKPLSLAGVMGGLESAIAESTSSILLEAACFESSHIRRSSRLSGISTESSRRFERGTDAELVKIALLRAWELIQDIAGGELEATSYLGNSQASENPIIEFSFGRFEELIGQEVSAKEVEEIFDKLGLNIISKQNSHFKVSIPSFRAGDLKRPVDLIEEIARFIGLNNIVSKPLPGVTKFLQNPVSSKNLKEILIAQGYSESIFSSLVPLDPSRTDAIKMKNPLSKEHAQLRTSLLPGLLKSVSINFHRQADSVRLFEIGKIYNSRQVIEENKPQNTGCEETSILAIVLAEKVPSVLWQGKTHSSGDFFELKSLVESLCEKKGKLQLIKPNSVNSFLHPGISAQISLNGRSVGELGQVHPLLAESLEIPENTFVAQIQLLPLSRPSKFKLKALNENPALNRDFTIDLPLESSLNNASIEKLIEANKFNNLQSFKLLSLYEPQDKRIQSLSYRLVFQAETGDNLSSREINEQIASFKTALLQKFPEAFFRE